MKYSKFAAVTIAIAALSSQTSSATEYGGACPAGMRMSITSAGIPKCVGAFIRPSAPTNSPVSPSSPNTNNSQPATLGAAPVVSNQSTAPISNQYNPTVVSPTPSTNGFVEANIIKSIYDYAHTLPWGGSNDSTSTALLASMAREHGWTASQIAQALGFTEQQIVDHMDRFGYRNFFGDGTPSTNTFVTGPGNSVMTPEDRAALARRTRIQDFFFANENNPQAIFNFMIQAGVSAKELATALDFRLNAINWLRLNGAPDGLGGLRVWDETTVRNFLQWQGAQNNPFGSGTIAEAWAKGGITDPYKDPTLLINAMDELDRNGPRR